MGASRSVRRRHSRRRSGLAALAIAIAIAVPALPFGFLTLGGAGAEVLAPLFLAELPTDVARPPRSSADAVLGRTYTLAFSDCRRSGDPRIDFDGSYWNAVPGQDLEAFSRLAWFLAVGRIRLTGGHEAVLMVTGAPSVRLTRHIGPKFFASCDGTILF